MAGFGEHSVGDLSGRRVVVTGANSGIGLETSRILLRHGADVVMACREETKGGAALRLVGSTRGRGEVARLDLADRSSIRSFADGLEGVTDLVNNAGIMACPLAFTADGLELQMATNHFGHALLTALLLPKLAPGGRVVFVSSIAARGGKLDSTTTAEDLTSPSPYSAQRVYSNTKQANLLFAQELERRLRAAKRATVSLAAHPGVSATELFPRQLRDSNRAYLVPLLRPIMSFLLQPASAGALPSVRALVDPAVQGGELIGPRWLGQTRGAPEFLPVYRSARDEIAARHLFELTESILGLEIVGAA